MKLAMPVGAYHAGNPADYLSKSFERLGHSVDILNRFELETSVREKRHDFYLCVDSGAPIDLFNACYVVDPSSLSRLAFWFIDYRHNKHRPPHERAPNDESNVKLVVAGGGWVFQSQVPDWQECWEKGFNRSSWLPLAADPEVWSDHSADPIAYDVAFIGNVWDAARAGALQSIKDSGITLGYNTTGHIWKESAAAFTGHAKMGFNISSFYGSPFAYDINMRVFETLSCGVPLITNWVPDLPKFFMNEPFVRTYRSEHEILPTIRAALNDPTFLESRAAAREWLLRNGTYDLRARQMIAALVNAGIWPEKPTALEATDEEVKG